jgi:hypothetical protein
VLKSIRIVTKMITSQTISTPNIPAQTSIVTSPNSEPGLTAWTAVMILRRPQSGCPVNVIVAATMD